MIKGKNISSANLFISKFGRILLAFLILFGMFSTKSNWVHASGTGTISGVVKDLDGDPIPDIVVTVNEYDSGAAAGPESSAVTGTDGSFLINVNPGEYRLRACPGCSSPTPSYENQYAGETGGTFYWNLARRVSISTAGEAQTADFTLGPGGSITGRIINATGDGVANLSVGVLDQTQEWLDGSQTDAEGYYSFYGLPVSFNAIAKVFACAGCDNTSPYSNKYYRALTPGVYTFADASPIAIQTGITTANLDITLELGNTIRGTVTDSAEDPLPLGGIKVAAITWDTGEWYKDVDTAADGSYTLSGLPDGTYRIQACPECKNQPYLSRYYNNAPDYNAASPLTLSDEQTLSEINFTLDPAAILTGTITDQSSGLPVANVPVYAANTQNGQDYRVDTDDQGQYSIYLEPGYYRLWARPSWNVDLIGSHFIDELYDSAATIEYAAIIHASSGTTTSNLDFQLETGGALTGTVTDAGETPLEGAEVMAVEMSGAARSFASQPTGQDGVFYFENLPAGSYRLRATRAGYQAQYYPQADWANAEAVVITTGDTQSGITFRLTSDPGLDPQQETVRQAMTLMGNYDPSQSAFVPQVMVIDQIFAGLTRINPADGKTIPNLLSASNSTDSQTWDFTLREGLTWSDGSPLTAEDLRYGLLRGLRLDERQIYLYNLFIIQGAQEYNQGMLSADQVGITVTDDTHISFQLTQPTAFFPTILATAAARPLPRLLMQAFPDTWLDPDKLITSGPYQLAEYQADHALFRKNESFIDQAQVNIPQVYIQNATQDEAWNLFLNGKLDTAAIPSTKIATVQADPILKNQFKLVDQQCTFFLGFNTDALGASNQPDDPALLRKALIETIDRDAYNQIANNGLRAARAFIPPGVLGHSDSAAYLPYNPTKAAADISAAFNGNYQGLPPFTLYYQTDVGNTASLKASTEYLANTWNQTLNTQFTVEGVTQSEFEAKFNNSEMPVWRRGWCSDYQDGYNFLSSLLNLRAQFGNWDQTGYQTLLQNTASILDEDLRLAAYQAVEQQILEKDAMLMPLYYSTATMLTKGFIRSYGVGGIDYIADWDFDRSDSTTLGSTFTPTALSLSAASVTFIPAGERGTVTYTLPDGAFPNGTALTHTGHLTNAIANLPDGKQNTSMYFSFQADRSPAADYSLTLRYSQEEINASNFLETTLSLYYWDDAAQAWVNDANSAVDPNTNTITTHSRHLGDWLVLGDTIQARVYLPFVSKR